VDLWTTLGVVSNDVGNCDGAFSGGWRLTG
jgi:hypothetical protein